MDTTSRAQHKNYLPFRGVLNDPSLYSALDPTSRQIRCVDLHPGSPADLVVCSLVYTTLDPEASEQPVYEALSYCWGSVDDTVGIYLRRHNTELEESVETLAGGTKDTNENFQVTRNLEAALRALRLPEKRRRLWVDAICINQMSDKEKTHQVSHMNLIYKSAAHVLVWLGESDIWSDAVFTYQRLLVQESEWPWPSLTDNWVAVRLSRLLAYEDDTYRLHWRMPHVPFHPERMKYLFLNSLGYLLERRWFRRMWVYPEVFMAPLDSKSDRLVTIVVGDSSMRWSSLIKLVQKTETYDHFKYLHKNIAWFSTSWSLPTTIPGGRNERVRDLTLAEYSSRTGDFLASDPRDKLFALLHLAQDTRSRVHTDSRLMPNYEKSILDIILDFSEAGISLLVEIRTAEPVVTETSLITSTFQFGLWTFSVGVLLENKSSPLHNNSSSHDYPFGATIVARVKESSYSAPGHKHSIVTTDGRLFSSNCMAGRGSLVVLPSGSSIHFVMHFIARPYGPKWRFLGTCTP